MFREKFSVSGFNLYKCSNELISKFVIMFLCIIVVHSYFVFFVRFYCLLMCAQPSFRKPDNFRTIQEEIARLSLEKRKPPFIIIDEANYINNATLKTLHNSVTMILISFYKSKKLNCCSFKDFTFRSVILSFSSSIPHNIGESGSYLLQFFTTLSSL